MLITNPSKDGKQDVRRSFTPKCKHDLIRKIESCRAFSASSDEASQKFVINRKIHPGHPCLLASLDDFLLGHVLEFCEQGAVVMT